MAYKVEHTELAEQDLDNILDYIAHALENPSAAASFADEVQSCYAHLEQMPQMYELCRNPHLRRLGYRKAIIKNYIMIYRISESNKTVYVLRYFYGRRDYEKLL